LKNGVKNNKSKMGVRNMKRLVWLVVGFMVFLLVGVTSAQEVRVAIQSFAHEALKPFIEQFETQTGIKVVLESMPSSGTDALTKLTTY